MAAKFGHGKAFYQLAEYSSNQGEYEIAAQYYINAMTAKFDPVLKPSIQHLAVILQYISDHAKYNLITCLANYLFQQRRENLSYIEKKMARI